MLNKDIKVSWRERLYIGHIERWIPFIGTKLYEAYVTQPPVVKKYGNIVDFTTNIFGKTYAIIDSGDNKIVKIPIEKLIVYHNNKKK